MINTERLQKLLCVLFVLLVLFIVVYLVLNTFVLNPITFHVKLEDRLLNKGEPGTLYSEIRNLAFYGLRDISIESYIVELDERGGVINNTKEKENLAHLYSVKGFSSSVVGYDFDTRDLEKGRYRIYSFVNYTSNYNMPIVQDWASKDFRII